MPRSHGFQDLPQSDLRHPLALDGNQFGRGVAKARGHPQRLADREQSDRDDDYVDAVQQLRDAQGEPCLAGLRIDADESDHQTDCQACQSTHQAGAEHRRDHDEGQGHQGDVVGRAELDRDPDDLRSDQRQQARGDGARDEAADGRRGQRGGAASRLGHLVAFDGGDDRRRFAWSVEQDGGGGAAVHAAVVDAGEHDERAGGREAVGDG